jgi:hypothetical protein
LTAFSQWKHNAIQKFARTLFHRQLFFGRHATLARMIKPNVFLHLMTLQPDGVSHHVLKSVRIIAELNWNFRTVRAALLQQIRMGFDVTLEK